MDSEALACMRQCRKCPVENNGLEIPVVLSIDFSATDHLFIHLFIIHKNILSVYHVIDIGGTQWKTQIKSLPLQNFYSSEEPCGDKCYDEKYILIKIENEREREVLFYIGLFSQETFEQRSEGREEVS